MKNDTSKRNVRDCPACHRPVCERRVQMSNVLVAALANVLAECRRTGKHEFKRNELSKAIGKAGEAATANFGYWIHFGGLTYRPAGKGRGFWGINLERTAAFLAGVYQVPEYVWIDTMTGQVVECGPDITVNQVPHIADMLDDEGNFIVEYRPSTVCKSTKT